MRDPRRQLEPWDWRIRSKQNRLEASLGLTHDPGGGGEQMGRESWGTPPFRGREWEADTDGGKMMEAAGKKEKSMIDHFTTKKIQYRLLYSKEYGFGNWTNSFILLTWHKQVK